MAEEIEKRLSEMAAPQLVKIVLAALDTMGESEQTDFIAKHIDARISLSRIGAYDSQVFLDEVEEFCLDCLNGVYYSDESDIEAYFSENDYGDSYYDDDWDYDEFYGNTEWAGTFSRLFELSVMYIRSGDIETGYEANARLLSCLEELSSNGMFLGTDDPGTYISLDWDEFFALHYDALFKYKSDQKQAVKQAFRYWKNFGAPCTEGFLNNVKDVALAESCILAGLKDTKDWTLQCQCFELLEQLYTRLGKSFDKASKAMALIEHNVYFYLIAIEGMCERADWRGAVETALLALPQIPVIDADTTDWSQERTRRKIRSSVQARLAEAYEHLEDFARAFEVARNMFFEAPDIELYKYARGLADKNGDAPAFFAWVEEGEKQKISDYGREKLLLGIYSYEGETKKMLDAVLSKDIDRNYYDRKYVALSLIFRALSDADNIGNDLSEYLTFAVGQEGIGDMIKSAADSPQRAELLLNGADMLKGIVAFHIAAAKRGRYAKAAYYMCVLRDIFLFLEREDEFLNYYNDIMAQNSRRPALRDEMSIVYGKLRR
jgi:hypothetical protein